MSWLTVIAFVGQSVASAFTPSYSVVTKEFNVTVDGSIAADLSFSWINENLVIKAGCREQCEVKDKNFDRSGKDVKIDGKDVKINIGCLDNATQNFKFVLELKKEKNRKEKHRKVNVSGNIICDISCSDPSVTTAGILSFLAILISGISFVIFAVNYRTDFKTRQPLPHADKEKLLQDTPTPVAEFRHDELKLLSTVIEGNFGACYRAQLERGGRIHKVFVKKLKEVDDGKQLKYLLQESDIFERLPFHPRIIKVTSYSYSERLFTTLYVQPTEGHLKSFLKRCWLRTNPSKRSTVSTYQLIQFTIQGAEALVYLSSNNIIHGDIAARNFLLDESNRNIFLCDTVLSQDLFPADYHEGRPIRWHSPECIDITDHSSQSGDVWAFGIFVWELFALAQSPYKDIDVMAISQYLSDGYRLVQPAGCPESIWSLISASCWQYSSSNRKTIQLILQELEDLKVIPQTIY